MPTTSLGFYPFLLLTWWAHNLNISQWRLCLRNLRNWLWCIQCMPHQPIWRKERSVHKKNPICLNRPFLWSEASHTVLCKVNGPAALWSSLNCDHLLLASVTPQTPGITRQHFNRVAASLCQHSWNLLTRRTASREFHQAKDPSRIARATDKLLDTIQIQSVFSCFLIHSLSGFPDPALIEHKKMWHAFLQVNTSDEGSVTTTCFFGYKR